MTPLSAEVALDLVARASRAPSVHNIQPARWRFNDLRVTLFRALDRTLPAADPTGHDVDISLGAAFEGMCLALSERSLFLDQVDFRPGEHAQGCAGVAAGTIASGCAIDSLAAHVKNRKSFRGKFAAALKEDLAAIRSVAAEDAIIIDDRSCIRELAKSHDDATWRFASKSEYHEELWSWLRLSARQPSWGRDGLNADCLGLSAPERIAARALLSPRIFSRLSRLGVGSRLVSERSQVESASALIVFAPPRSTSSFDAGRRFYRLWLEITSIGLAAVPMSASADDAESNTSIARMIDLPADRRIANVFRVGRPGVRQVSMSPRIPPRELVV